VSVCVCVTSGAVCVGWDTGLLAGHTPQIIWHYVPRLCFCLTFLLLQDTKLNPDVEQPFGARGNAEISF